jgi:hypothetical protein
MNSRSRVFYVVVGLSACGAVVGALCAIAAVTVALATRSPADAASFLAPSPIMGAIAQLGATIGAVGAPALAFGLLRRVPLGRAIVLTGVGTVLGAVMGEWLAPFNPYDLDLSPGILRGALAGFLATGIGLRFAFRARGPSDSIERAV